MKELKNSQGKHHYSKKTKTTPTKKLRDLGKKSLSLTSASRHFPSVQEIQNRIGSNLKDALFIHKSAKKDTHGHCYRGEFIFKDKDEAKKINAGLVKKNEDALLFVYNEKTQDLRAFEKGDCLLYEQGYCISQGKYNVYYDNAGNELGRDIPLDKSEIN